MKTDPRSSHKHTTDGKTSTANGGHAHGLKEVDAALAALEARVSALEGPPVDPPPDVEPPPVEPPPVDPPPVVPPSGKSVTVDSVASLLSALADDAVGEIVMRNGLYPIEIAGAQTPHKSLWIGKQFTGRTRPILVRAETDGKVAFDGQQSRYWGGITFAEGAHDQRWKGFRWINGEATGTGVIVVGGYEHLAPTHRITLDDCEISEFYGTDTGNHGHGIYVSQAFGGPHTDLTLNRFKVIDTGAHIGGGIHLYHDSFDGEASAKPNYFNVKGMVVRGAKLTGCNVGVYVWAHTAQDILIEDTRIENARSCAVRYERGENVTFRRVVSVNSHGFSDTAYIPGGPYKYPNIPELGVDKVPGPKMVTFEDCSFG